MEIPPERCHDHPKAIPIRVCSNNCSECPICHAPLHNCGGSG